MSTRRQALCMIFFSPRILLFASWGNTQPLNMAVSAYGRWLALASSSTRPRSQQQWALQQHPRQLCPLVPITLTGGAYPMWQTTRTCRGHLILPGDLWMGITAPVFLCQELLLLCYYYEWIVGKVPKRDTNGQLTSQSPNSLDRHKAHPRGWIQSKLNFPPLWYMTEWKLRGNKFRRG